MYTAKYHLATVLAQFKAGQAETKLDLAEFKVFIAELKFKLHYKSTGKLSDGVKREMTQLKNTVERETLELRTDLVEVKGGIKTLRDELRNIKPLDIKTRLVGKNLQVIRSISKNHGWILFGMIVMEVISILMVHCTRLIYSN